MKEKFVNHSIGDLCISLNGLWKGKKEPFVNVGVIRNANFTKDFKLDYSKIEFIDVEKRLFEKRNLQNGDLIIEKSGGSDKNPVGRAILYEGESGRYSYSNFTSVLRIKEKNILSSKYLYNYILYRYKQGDMGSMQSNTTGIHNLDYEKYLAIQIPVPSLPEQERIVKILDAAFEKIDRLKQNAEKSLQEVKNLWEAILRDELKPKEGWRRLNITEIATLKAGKSLDKKDVIDTYKEGYYPVFGGNGHRGYVPYYNQEGDYNIIGRQGALCGNIQEAHGKFYATEHAVLVTPKIDLNFRFLNYSLIQANINQYATGAAQPGISVSNVNEVLYLNIPSKEEQSFVVGRLQKGFTICQHLQQKLEKELSEYEALKQSILRKAFSGEL